MGQLGLTETEILQRLAVALLLGLFIGLEREYSKATDKPHERRAAGLRTHALIGLLGGLSGLLSALSGPAALAVLLGVLALLVSLSYYLTSSDQSRPSYGMTSEVTILLTFVLGVTAFYGQLKVAVVSAGAASVILSAKQPLHRFVKALSVEDWVAVMKFAVVTLVVLPLLPNRAYGPYLAFNPYKIWLLVVLIASVSFLGYALTKVIGAARGMALTGLIGGLASSTAVTLACARRSRETPELSEPLALATVLACTVMIPRLAIIIAVLYPPLLAEVAPAFTAMVAAPLLYAWWLNHRSARIESRQTEHANPFELRSALKFAGVFALVMLVVKAAQASGVGQSGLYLVSFLGGLVETDAIIVTLAETARGQTMALGVAATGIVLACIGNSTLKALLALGAGARPLGRQVLAALSLTAVAGGLALWLG